MIEITTAAPGKQLLTHSRLACFRACPRRHFIRYELGIKPISDDLPRRVGSAFHAALDACDRNLDVSAAITAMDDPYEAAMVAAMFEGHVLRYAGCPLDPVASEQEFDLPLINPETGAATPIWRMAGKVDRIVTLPDGRLALQEYKTTSRDFAPGADYWLRLHLDQQLSIYVIAARALGYDVQTVIYDVTRRPGQRPLKATPEDKRQYVKATGKLYANQRDMDETPEEYGNRIASDIRERPDHYFARIEIARLDQDILECQADLWDQQLALRECQRSLRWWRNPESCQTAVGACGYLPVCINRDLSERTPDGFIRDTNIHPELSGSATNEG